MCLWYYDHHIILFTDTFYPNRTNTKETFPARMNNNALFFGSFWSCCSVSSSSSSHSVCLLLHLSCHCCHLFQTTALKHCSLHTDVTCLHTKKIIKTRRRWQMYKQELVFGPNRWWESNSQRWYDEPSITVCRQQPCNYCGYMLMYLCHDCSWGDNKQFWVWN